MIKYIFIVNPAAGKGVEFEPTIAKIRDACAVSHVNYEIYRTSAVGDATEFVKSRIASKPPRDIFRFYACGGDGTLSEVVAAAVNERLGRPIPGVQIGCIPIGTGNDFVRNFSQSEFFSDITKQLLADPITIDCYAADGRFGVNMINIGFDCDVVCKAAELKKKPFVPKKLAYVFGILFILIKNRGLKLTVVRSDGSRLNGEFELVSAANGGFCGGGFHSAPKSMLDDGLIDLSFIKKMSRTSFLRLIGPYKRGTHLRSPLGKKVITYLQDKSVTFCFSEDTNICIDGEIIRQREINLRVIPHAIEFLMPVGVVYPQSAQTGDTEKTAATV